MPLERLQTIIAAAGIASRRKAEELITGGLVSVNGQVVTELGTKADPATDHIKVAGKALQGPERHFYLLLHKPKGYVTTAKDPEGRPTVIDLIRGVGSRVYPVGRLDYASEGLLILTNDSTLSTRLTDPEHHVPKTYHVRVKGCPDEAVLTRLRDGVELSDGPTRPARVRLLRRGKATSLLEVILTEGRNRQGRRMLAAVGHRVRRLVRVAIGAYPLDDLPAGACRPLSEEECRLLTQTGP